MSYFKMDAVTSWDAIAPKELLEFEATEARRIRLAFMTNGPTEVWAATESREILVGFGTGQFEVEFTTDATAYVRCLADDETSIFMRGYAPSMVVPESVEENLTSIMPRERRNTEFDRMVMWTKLNEARREAQLAEAIASLKAQAAPTAAPQPDPNPVVETDGA
jgi:hypothetical protein